MSFLVRLDEAVEKLRTFLQSTSSESGVKRDNIESLFAPPVQNRMYGIDVEVAFLLSPVAHRVPLYVLLPHEVASGNVCLITPAPQNSFESKVLALSDSGDAAAKRVRRVLDTKALNTMFTDPVAVRMLAKSYDNFVVYGAHKYPKQLTAEFLGHQRMPVWMSKKKKLSVALDQATRTCVIPRRGENSVTCRVGHTGLTAKQVVENVRVLVDELSKHPQGARLSHILHIRVAATNAEGKRAGLTVYAHKFDFSTAVEPAAKRERKESPIRAGKK